MVSRGFDSETACIIDETFDIIGVTVNTRNTRPVMSNVAIASAVTSYARIVMMPVKDENCCYTDTDSVITTVPLPKELMGSEIGLFKDELDGKLISQGLFLGIKQYGYIIDDTDKSVFAGVPRNTIKFSELKAIASGETLNKKVNNKFIKSMKDLKMKILSSNLNIKANNEKILINNRYYPITVNIPANYSNTNKLLRIFKGILRIINRVISRINNN